MKNRLSLFLIAFLLWNLGNGQNTFVKAIYYEALASNNAEQLNEQLNRLQNSNNPGKTAYLGALNMKRAGLLKEPGEKLKLFKSGHQQLETSIQKDSLNPEWRFLRLMIQENTPKILNYHAQLGEDAAYLRNHYWKLDEKTRKALLEYSRHSKVISTKDLEQAHE